ncbi:MAG: CRISPR system precrRNA processing endoribonuclease RAMP protein Cas6 [Candidatus Cloacimonadales bacterium]|nr:CRISPR system precrRNA processing endoribonuclease RAMP protein Cas6 [Candidatus Cloacimonadales bacterium]
MLSTMTFDIHLKCSDEIVLPKFAPATIRGAFGIQLKRLVCVQKYRDQVCQRCLLKSSCLYAYIFEGHKEERSDNGGFYTAEPPHPFILDVPFNRNSIIFPRNALLKWSMSLFGGRIKEILPYVVMTLERIGESGIGRTRGHYVLDSLVQVDIPKPRLLYHSSTKNLDMDFAVENLDIVPHFRNPVKEININMMTPLRIKQGGEIAREISFDMIITNILRRFSILIQYYSKHQLNLEINPIIEAARDIKTIRQDIQWTDYARFSGRKKQWIRLGGIIGKLSFGGELDPFIPWLYIGRKINVGKSTSFGFGKIDY